MQTLRTLISNNIEIWTWSTFTLMGSYHGRIKAGADGAAALLLYY